MLTKSDLKNIKALLKDSIEPVKKDIKIIKKDVKYLKKTVDIIGRNYDEGDAKLHRRVLRIEQHLALPEEN